ncbi:MAG TPA: hypothetical protein GXX19_12815 [Syntrophomonadaceae bacterium]|nr:hypothetical protein [Syntrophomonadaceae bacterium]
MSPTDNNMIGKQIVTKIDALIDVIMSVSLQNKESREELYRRGCDLIREVSVLLEKFLGTSEYYIKQAIQELVKQRLPVNESLVEDFFDILEKMLFYEAPLSAESTSGKISFTATCDDLQRALSFLFPNTRIIKNCRFQGVDLEYYIPSCKLAVVNAAKEKCLQARKDYICKSHGIQLIRVDPQKLTGYREIIRHIKRELRQFS